MYFLDEFRCLYKLIVSIHRGCFCHCVMLGILICLECSVDNYIHCIIVHNVMFQNLPFAPLVVPVFYFVCIPISYESKQIESFAFRLNSWSDSRPISICSK